MILSRKGSTQNNMATTIKPMLVGQTEKVHVKAYSQDNSNNPSQSVDTVTPLTATVNFATIATVAVDPLDNRAFIVTAVGAGIATITIDEAPSVNPKLVLNVSISAAPADNRRIDFLAADDPT